MECKGKTAIATNQMFSSTWMSGNTDKAIGLKAVSVAFSYSSLRKIRF